MSEYTFITLNVLIIFTYFHDFFWTWVGNSTNMLSVSFFIEGCGFERVWTLFH